MMDAVTLLLCGLLFLVGGRIILPVIREGYPDSEVVLGLAAFVGVGIVFAGAAYFAFTWWYLP